MDAVAIRLDDIHGRTPLDLLHRMTRELWRGKPVTYAVIPYPAQLCLGPEATAAEVSGPRSTIQHKQLVRLLEGARRDGSDIALHGLTHADHKSAAGPAVPELVDIMPSHADMLVRTLRTWRHEFGTSVVVPPHNAIDADLARGLVEHGYLISRSITNDEVAALGFDTTLMGRAAAKLIAPEYRPLGQSHFFQTASVSARYIRNSACTPEDTANTILRVAHESGNATLTLHWWDFMLPATSKMTWAYTTELLECLARRINFVSIKSFGHGDET